MTLSTASAALEAVGDPYFVVDENGTLQEWNDTVPAVTGYDDETLATHSGIDLFVESDAETVVTGFEMARESGKATIEADLRLADGDSCPYEIDLVGLEDGLVAGLGWDISQRREQRESMLNRERVLRGMYDIISDSERSFEEQVRALLMLGRNELDVAYGSLSRIEGEEYLFEIVHTDDDSIQEGDIVPLEATNCELVATDKQTLVLGDIGRDAPEETDRAGYAEWGISCYVGAPVYVEDEVYGTFCFYDTEPRSGSFSAWHVTLVDLMSRWVSYALQRRSDTEQLRRQNEKLDQFASIVSHDLRNPLNVLQGSLELMEDDGVNADGNADENVERAERAVERMETLIDDLLVLARAGTEIDEPEPVALGSAVQRAWTSVDTAAAELVVDTERIVQADDSRLRQLLENLIRNSIEHGSAGDEPLTITIGDLDDGFYVADDGVGIPEENRDEVFEMGFTTRSGGTGFGLAIVAEIAEAHGWSVAVAESEDGGAQFEFTGVDIGTEFDDVGESTAE